MSNDLSPFLKTGVTWAFHQSAGSLPFLIDCSNITRKIGAISSLSSFNKRGLSQFGPFNVNSNFLTGISDYSKPLTLLLSWAII